LLEIRAMIKRGEISWRIKRFVALCAQHETIHPPRQTTSGARSAKASRKAPPKK
jgi:hypothetical protein